MTDQIILKSHIYSQMQSKDAIVLFKKEHVQCYLLVKPICNISNGMSFPYFL